MERELNDNESIAAYHAGRLSAEEREAFETHMAIDAAFAAEVEALGPVADWLQRSFAAAPSANYRLSPERVAAIRAAAQGGIVEFPAVAKAARAPRRRSIATRLVRRYGLATAAAVAMIIGGVSGFETGRVQFADTSAPVLVAVELPDAPDLFSDADLVHPYPPAYGLDHADLRAMAARSARAPHESASVGFAALPQRDYGLPGPGSPYLRSRELLFLQ